MDDDSDVHGDLQEFVDQEEYIEGTKWSCCSRPGSDLGCEKRAHFVDMTQARKR